MNTFSQTLIRTWAGLGPRFLPFADAATPDLPLPRLLRLSLFQVSVGMALVLLVGTLNRVMIVELGVPATLVAVMIALPVLYAPFRALVGHRSDNHRSALGWRRVPYIWMGTLIQFGGLAIMPFALLVLAGGGNAANWPAWIGQAGRRPRFPARRRRAAHHPDRRAGADDRSRAARVAAARGGLDVRDAAVGHRGERPGLWRLAGRLQPRPPGPGDPGLRRRHPASERDCPVEAGDAAPAPRRPRPCAPCQLSGPHGKASFRPGVPGAGSSQSASAPWLSACRTCCWNPTAAAF